MGSRRPKLRFQSATRFVGELRRRKVIRVAAVYAVVAWLVIQIATQTFPALHLPDWAATFVVVLAILGFPIALVLAWALELTPAGVRSEQPSDSPAVPTAPKSHPSRPITRSGPVSARTPRQPVSATPSAVEDAPTPDPQRERRALVARLRHDLRTPMNAILGYGSVLTTEAEELGITALVSDIQRLDGAARKLLEQIDHLLPSGPEASDVDVASIRTRLHEALLHPASQLVAGSQELLAKAGSSERASADLERQLGAARRLFTLIEQLASPPAGEVETAGRASFEQVFSRLRPNSGTSRIAVRAGTLLVVDDDAMNRDLLTRQLAREGYSVFTAGSGTEALETLRLHDFDLILLDVMMPGMDGVQVLERIQSDPLLCEIPVVMISALDEIDSVVRCIEKGAVDYLAKPFDPLLLRTRVSTPLLVHQLRQDLRLAEAELIHNRAFIDDLSRSVAPPPLSDGLKRGERTACAHYSEVTAVVAHLEGLDAMAARYGPRQTIERVNETLRALEQCSSAQGIEIVRMTDRSCTAIVGAPEWREDHAEAAADYALSLVDAVRKASQEAADHAEIRVGLNTGALIAGIVGEARLVFGMWGDAVVTAGAIARQAPPGRIQVSAATCAKLNGKFELGSPTVIEVPAHGHLRAYVLNGRRVDSAVQ
jgi:CheY-like chemotaxis protein/signal transduction histidine kinase